MIFATVFPGQILSDVLRREGMAQKEAAILTEMDPAHFCRMCQDIGTFDLQKVKRLPWRILAPFWSKFIACVADEDMRAMRAERLLMVKSDLFQRDERKGA